MLLAQQDNLYTMEEARASDRLYQYIFNLQHMDKSKVWTTDKKCTLNDCKLYIQEWTEIKIVGKKLSDFNRLLPSAT